MANFLLDGTIDGIGSVSGGVWPSLGGSVIGDGSAANNVRGRVVANVNTAGLVSGVGVVTGFVTRTISGEVSGVGVVTGLPRHTPRVSGDVVGIGSVTGIVTWDAKVSGLVSGVGAVIGMPAPGVSGEVARPGVVTGDLVPAFKITGVVSGVGSVTQGQRITGTVSGGSSVTGTIHGGPSISGTVSGTQGNSGVLRLDAKITNALVLGNGEVTGALVRERSASASAEGDYEATGVRRGLPILVYERNALGMGSLANVPDNGNFLVSASFVAGPGDPFYEAGAAPNAIGTKVQPLIGSSYLLFRPPLEDEVVWSVYEEQTFRYRENIETNVAVWVKYATWPQRAADGMKIFTLFDPDRIYTYYLKMLGAIQYQLGYDNQVLLDQIDPSKVSRFYLPELAANYGLSLEFDDDLPVRRAKTRNAVAVAKKKGLEEGVSLRLRSLGYTGYVNDIWVDPTDAGNFQSAAVNENNTPTSSPTGAGTAYREYPHGYRSDDPSDGFYPSSRVAVHLNDGSGNPLQITQEIKDRVAKELGRDVLPAFVDIRYFVTDVTVEEDGVGVEDDLEILQV